jgi:hypothetical protein
MSALNQPSVVQKALRVLGALGDAMPGSTIEELTSDLVITLPDETLTTLRAGTFVLRRGNAIIASVGLAETRDYRPPAHQFERPL